VETKAKKMETEAETREQILKTQFGFLLFHNEIRCTRVSLIAKINEFGHLCVAMLY